MMGNTRSGCLCDNDVAGRMEPFFLPCYFLLLTSHLGFAVAVRVPLRALFPETSDVDSRGLVPGSEVCLFSLGVAGSISELTQPSTMLSTASVATERNSSLRFQSSCGFHQFCKACVPVNNGCSILSQEQITPILKRKTTWIPSVDPLFFFFVPYLRTC